jgi:hypothetical protein
MTTQQLYLFNGLYLIILVAVSFLTRATPRRIAGALAGMAVDGVLGIAIIAIGERAGLWHMAITWEPYFLLLLWIGFTLSAFALLIVWRIARRFGARGLVVVFVAAMLLGPVRDYGYMARFREWGAYSPGIAPVLAVSLAYVLGFVVGYGVMRLIAGPATADRLARGPRGIVVLRPPARGRRE